jgi:hypothetical protein
MEMIRQHHNGIDAERKVSSCRGDGEAEGADPINEQALPSLQQIDGKEPAAPGIKARR